jgi:hypothetical protein
VHRLQPAGGSQESMTNLLEMALISLSTFSYFDGIYLLTMEFLMVFFFLVQATNTLQQACSWRKTNFAVSRYEVPFEHFG